jgi:hypothetical protein
MIALIALGWLIAIWVIILAISMYFSKNMS